MEVLMKDGGIPMERERQDIKRAAGEITDLWWARPDQNGHIKTAVVEEIIQRALWGFSDYDARGRKG